MTTCKNLLALTTLAACIVLMHWTPSPAQDGDLPRPSDGYGNGGGTRGFMPFGADGDSMFGILDSPSRGAEYDVDLAFRSYVDPDALSQAIHSRHPSQLTDIGFQLAVGERTLLRPHKIGSSKDILDWAVLLATNAGDAVTLERIARFSKEHGHTNLETRASQAARLAAASRTVMYRLPDIEPKDDNDRRYIEAIRSGLDRAVAGGDRSEAQRTAEFIREAQMLPKEINDQLAAAADQLASELPESVPVPAELANSLTRLTGESRGVSRGPRNRPGNFRLGDEKIRFAAGIVENIDFKRDQLSEAALQLVRRAEARNETHVWDDQWLFTTLPDNRSKYWVMVGHHVRSDGAKKYKWVAIKATPSRWIVMDNDGSCYYPKNKEQTKLTWWPNGQKVDFDVYNPEGGNWTPNDIWYGFGY